MADTVWATGLWPDGFWAEGLWSGGEAPEPDPTPVESNSGGWAFFIRYQEGLDRRRKKRQEQIEASDAVQELPPVDKEIATLLQKQERIDEHKSELKRLKALVDEYREVPALSTRAVEAFERARVRGLRSDLVKLDKELKRMSDEEEQVLQLLIKDWDV